MQPVGFGHQTVIVPCNADSRKRVDDIEIPGFNTTVTRQRKQSGNRNPQGARRYYYRVRIEGPWETEWAEHALRTIQGARLPGCSRRKNG